MIVSPRRWQAGKLTAENTKLLNVRYGVVGYRAAVVAQSVNGAENKRLQLRGYGDVIASSIVQLQQHRRLHQLIPH